MPPSERRLRYVTVFLVLFSVLVSRSAAIKARCSACKCVADAFLKRLENERVRNHLDMRHRLDKNGKRYGKVIDYKVSELRVSELLDDLCEDMEHFTWAKQKIWGETTAESGVKWTWVRRQGKGSVSLQPEDLPPEEEGKTLRKELKTYCYALIERTEDSLSAYLSSGAEHHEDLDEYICEQLVGHCRPTAATSNSTAGDGGQEEL